MGESVVSKVIIHQGHQEQAELAQDGNKETVIVLECISAANYIAKPLMIYKGQSHLKSWSTMPGYMYGYSKSGWIDTKLYKHWVKIVFECETSKAQVFPLINID